MVVKRTVTKKNYILAFVITGLIFVVAFLFGMVADRMFVEHVDRFNDETRYDMFRLELRNALLEDKICDYKSDSFVKNEFGYVSAEIMQLETKLGKTHQKVMDLKKYYTLLEIYDWLHYKKIKEECGSDYDLILYFYSNKEDSQGNDLCEDCERQGFILSYIKSENPSSVRVYSFDYDLESEEVGILKSLYGIDSFPSIVINDNVIRGFSELEDIEYFL